MSSKMENNNVGRVGSGTEYISAMMCSNDIYLKIVGICTNTYKAIYALVNNSKVISVYAHYIRMMSTYIDFFNTLNTYINISNVVSICMGISNVVSTCLNTLIRYATRGWGK